MAHPPRPNRRPPLLEKVRAICLKWPESSEKVAWGGPTFRVKDKLFAMYLDNHHGDERIALWIKAPPGVQELLVEAEPERFFRPPYVGPSGWIGIRLDGVVDWSEITDFLADGYRLAAPKKLAAKFDPGVTTAPASPPAKARPQIRKRRA
jgi:hypothetical protein